MHELILTSPLTLKSADAPPSHVLAGRALILQMSGVEECLEKLKSAKQIVLC